jgi:hypothetical protein
MIETVIAVMGLVSAGIFLALAFEDYRTRDTHHLLQTEPVPKSSVNSGEHIAGVSCATMTWCLADSWR